jgi:hypothetical protein
MAGAGRFGTVIPRRTYEVHSSVKVLVNYKEEGILCHQMRTCRHYLSPINSGLLWAPMVLFGHKQRRADNMDKGSENQTDQHRVRKRIYIRRTLWTPSEEAIDHYRHQDPHNAGAPNIHSEHRTAKIRLAIISRGSRGSAVATSI